MSDIPTIVRNAIIVLVEKVGSSKAMKMAENPPKKSTSLTSKTMPPRQSPPVLKRHSETVSKLTTKRTKTANTANLIDGSLDLSQHWNENSNNNGQVGRSDDSEGRRSKSYTTSFCPFVGRLSPKSSIRASRARVRVVAAPEFDKDNDPNEEMLAISTPDSGASSKDKAKDNYGSGNSNNYSINYGNKN